MLPFSFPVGYRACFLAHWWATLLETMLQITPGWQMSHHLGHLRLDLNPLPYHPSPFILGMGKGFYPARRGSLGPHPAQVRWAAWGMAHAASPAAPRCGLGLGFPAALAAPAHCAWLPLPVCPAPTARQSGYVRSPNGEVHH